MDFSDTSLICQKPGDPMGAPFRPASGVSSSSPIGGGSCQNFQGAAQTATANPPATPQCQEVTDKTPDLSPDNFGAATTDQLRKRAAIGNIHKPPAVPKEIDWVSETGDRLRELIGSIGAKSGVAMSVAYGAPHFVMTAAWYIPGKGTETCSLDFAVLVQKIDGGNVKDIVVSVHGHPIFKDGQGAGQVNQILLAQRQTITPLNVFVLDVLNKIADASGRQLHRVVEAAQTDKAGIETQVAKLCRDAPAVIAAPVPPPPKPRTMAQILMGL
jgi:hypothetical protein